MKYFFHIHLVLFYLFIYLEGRGGFFLISNLWLKEQLSFLFREDERPPQRSRKRNRERNKGEINPGDFFSQSFPIQSIGKEKQRQVWDTDHCILLQHWKKRFQTQKAFEYLLWWEMAALFRWSPLKHRVTTSQIQNWLVTWALKYSERRSFYLMQRIKCVLLTHKDRSEDLKSEMNNKSTKVIK